MQLKKKKITKSQSNSSYMSVSNISPAPWLALSLQTNSPTIFIQCAVRTNESRKNRGTNLHTIHCQRSICRSLDSRSEKTFSKLGEPNRHIFRAEASIVKKFNTIYNFYKLSNEDLRNAATVLLDKIKNGKRIDAEYFAQGRGITWLCTDCKNSGKVHQFTAKNNVQNHAKIHHQ